MMILPSTKASRTFLDRRITIVFFDEMSATLTLGQPLVNFCHRRFYGASHGRVSACGCFVNRDNDRPLTLASLPPPP